MRIVYLAHPVSAPTAEGVAENIARARRFLAWAWRTFPDCGFVADWLLCVELWGETNPADRARGLAFDTELVTRCDEIWLVGGRVSDGMRQEMGAAVAAGLPVLDLSHLGIEPPGPDEYPALSEQFAESSSQ